MFDQQRVHFAKLQNQQAEAYFQNHRDMTKAAMEANFTHESQKKDREQYLKEQEKLQDLEELDVARQTRQQYVASSDMTRYNQF